jgi:hypothetical protein
VAHELIAIPPMHNDIRSRRGHASCPAVVLVLALTTGCASSSAPGWSKPGMTEEQLRSDTLACMNEATTTMPSREGPRTQVDQTRYQRCMADRGYSAAPPK